MKNVLRVGYHVYHDEAAFAAHLAMVKRNRDIIDEVAMFTEFSHYGYWDAATTARTAETVRDRVRRYKEAGVKSVGVNVLCTIGHIEECWDVLPRAPLQYMVNEKGETSRSCLCPTGEDYLAHTARRYATLAASGVDFIWIDDDIRIEGHGISGNFCFCPRCIGLFNRENGSSYTREALVGRMQTDPALQKAWHDFAHRRMTAVLETVSRAVKETDPAVAIGYMSIFNNAEPEWIAASRATKGRPGGGFYNDERPINLFEKCFSVQRQLQNYPAAIRDIQYEYEAFNYQSLEKSLHMSELESTLCIMSGCNGVLYNNFMFDDREDLLETIRGSKKKWDLLTALGEGCRNAGVYCATIEEGTELNEIGIPVTACLEAACAAFVIGQTLERLPDEQLKKLLQKNLLTDGHGLEVLCERGFAQDCGGCVEKAYTNGMAEQFTAHESNAPYQNYVRDIFMNFYFESCAYALRPAEDAEPLSRLITVTRKPVGCSMYRRQSAGGSRIVADGYLMPRQMRSAAKRRQLTAALQWLSGGRLPAVIEKPVKVMPTVRQAADGGVTVMLTNASFDATGRFECVMPGERHFSVIGADGSLIEPEQYTENGTTRIRLENIPGWDYLLLTDRA